MCCRLIPGKPSRVSFWTYASGEREELLVKKKNFRPCARSSAIVPYGDQGVAQIDRAVHVKDEAVQFAKRNSHVAS